MPSDPFSHSIGVSEDRLRVERFVETRNVQSFDCGDKDLNDFLCTEDENLHVRLIRGVILVRTEDASRVRRFLGDLGAQVHARGVALTKGDRETPQS